MLTRKRNFNSYTPKEQIELFRTWLLTCTEKISEDEECELITYFKGNPSTVFHLAITLQEKGPVVLLNELRNKKLYEKIQKFKALEQQPETLQKLTRLEKPFLDWLVKNYNQREEERAKRKEKAIKIERERRTKLTEYNVLSVYNSSIPTEEELKTSKDSNNLHYVRAFDKDFLFFKPRLFEQTERIEDMISQLANIDKMPFLLSLSAKADGEVWTFNPDTIEKLVALGIATDNLTVITYKNNGKNTPYVKRMKN